MKNVGIRYDDKIITEKSKKEMIYRYVSNNLNYAQLINSEKTYVMAQKGLVSEFFGTLMIVYVDDIKTFERLKKSGYYSNDYQMVAEIIKPLDISRMMESNVIEYVKNNKEISSDEIFRYAIRLIYEFDATQRNNLFGFNGDIKEITNRFTIHEIKEKIDEYDKEIEMKKEQEKKIKIGDIVRVHGQYTINMNITDPKIILSHEIMVTYVDDRNVEGICIDTGKIVACLKKDVEKTNKSGTFEELFNRLKKKYE